MSGINEQECPVCEGCGRLKYAGKNGQLGRDTSFDITCWGCKGTGVVRYNPDTIEPITASTIARMREALGGACES